MFSSIKGFLTRHKRKFIVAGVVIGGAVFGTRYAQRKIIEWQESEAKEFLERTRKQHHFESTERTCNQTILSLAPTLRENVAKIINTEERIKKLKERPADKIALWEELKILSFTKISVLIYSGTMLVIALRIQLNIIGGHLYCGSSLPGDELSISVEQQEKYLLFCQHFLNEGVNELCDLIRSKVCMVLEGMSLSQPISLQDVEHIFWGIQSTVNSDPNNPLNNLSRLLFKCDMDKEDEFTRTIMRDTIDLLESEEVVALASSCLSRGFSNTIDRMADYFTPEENGTAMNGGPSTSMQSVRQSPKFTHISKITKPMAKVIPIVNGLANKSGKADLLEPWISTFIFMDTIKTLGANVYESFSVAQ